MLELLKEIQDSSKFVIPIFDGALLVEGRVLSPAEVEAAGLTSSMIAREIIPKKGSGSNLLKLQSKIEGKEITDLDDDTLQQILDAMSSVRPESLLKMEEQQNKILCLIVQRASQDQGMTWERLHLVTAVDQQNADSNRLWVGMISKDDRASIMDKALTGHQEASVRVGNFRSRSDLSSSA